MERVAFRGNSIELSVRTNGLILTARRALDESAIEVGETVDVFVYRLFVTVGNEAYLIENSALREEPVVI